MKIKRRNRDMLPFEGGIRDTMSTCGIVSESSQNRRKDEGTTLLFSLRGLGICLEEFVIFSKP